MPARPNCVYADFLRALARAPGHVGSGRSGLSGRRSQDKRLTTVLDRSCDVFNLSVLLEFLQVRLCLHRGDSTSDYRFMTDCVNPSLEQQSAKQALSHP